MTLQQLVTAWIIAGIFGEIVALQNDETRENFWITLHYHFALTFFCGAVFFVYELGCFIKERVKTK
jgi:uncharacterized membrane protein HdeD (DUF308 family)